jgi:hypothetical protein
MVQGILYTLSRSGRMIFGNDESFLKGWSKFKNEIWSNKYEKDNLKKLFYDVLFWMLLSFLFGVILKDGYEEFKKDKSKNDIVSNAFIELMYSAGSRSYDGFKGIFAITDYALNDVEPMAVNANVSLMKDLGKTMFGSMEFDTLLYKDVPVFRAFKQTHNKLSNIT